MSTVSPQTSRTLAARAAARGAEMLSAPVSGSVPAVETGTLGDHGRRVSRTPSRGWSRSCAELGSTVTFVGDDVPRPAAQAGHQHQPRRADAGVQRRCPARRAGRGRPVRCPRRADPQCHRLTDAAGPRAAASRPARERLVRRRHDAEGPRARPRQRACGGTADALDHRGRRDPHRSPEQPATSTGTSRLCSTCSPSRPRRPIERPPSDEQPRQEAAPRGDPAARRRAKRSSRPRWSSCSTRDCTR